MAEGQTDEGAAREWFGAPGSPRPTDKAVLWARLGAAPREKSVPSPVILRPQAEESVLPSPDTAKGRKNGSFAALRMTQSETGFSGRMISAPTKRCKTGGRGGYHPPLCPASARQKNAPDRRARAAGNPADRSSLPAPPNRSGKIPGASPENICAEPDFSLSSPVSEPDGGVFICVRLLGNWI